MSNTVKQYLLLMIFYSSLNLSSTFFTVEGRRRLTLAPRYTRPCHACFAALAGPVPDVQGQTLNLQHESIVELEPAQKHMARRHLTAGGLSGHVVKFSKKSIH